LSWKKRRAYGIGGVSEPVGMFSRVEEICSRPLNIVTLHCCEKAYHSGTPR
jgi:hypothetical protein